MNKKLLLTCLLVSVLTASNAGAQMFYSSSYDSGFSKSSSTPEKPKNEPVEDTDPETKDIPAPIKDRLRLDAVHVLAAPDEVYCYGIARKNPKNKTDTVSGYALNGECGTLNEEGLKAVQEKFFDLASFEMSASKISSACVIKPRVMLRFRRGIDFVDAVVSGDKCPGIVYFYAGETKEFYAKPISEWMDTFITAVSNDVIPIGADPETKKMPFMVRPKKAPEPPPAPMNAPDGINVKAPAGDGAQPPAPPEPPAQKVWGRKFN